MENKGADLVGQAILGKESRTVLIGGRAYFIKPPTIRKIAGAGTALGDITADSFGDVMRMMKDLPNMLGIEDFQKLSGLSRSVRRLIANPK